MSLDKVLQLAGAGGSVQPPDEVQAAELVLAAQTGLQEVLSYLTRPDDETETDHTRHPVWAALVGKDVLSELAASMCARSDKKMAATVMAQAALIALSGLTAPEQGWVEAADLDTWTTAALAGQEGTYQSAQFSAVSSGVRAVAGAHGITVTPAFTAAVGEQAAESLLVLAAKATGDGGVAMNHAPFTGVHTHSHFQSAAHAHPHQHVNDSTHDGGPLHRPGSSPKRAW
jgi:hypothetical protein